MERKRVFAILLILSVLATACSGTGDDLAIEDQNALALVAEPEATTTTIAPTSTTATTKAVAPTTTESTTTVPTGPTTTTTIDISTTTTEVNAPTVPKPQRVRACEAPDLEVRFVNVEPDNNAGQINARSNPGTDFDVVETRERGTTAFTVGVCEQVNETNWWAIVGNDGDPVWVAGQFLSAEPVLDPGVGNPIDSSEYVGLAAGNLDVLLGNIATALGISTDVVVSPTEPIVQDATAFSQTFTLTGLTNEESNGYEVNLQLRNALSEDGAQVVSVTVLDAQISPLCTRGVLPDGVCI